MADCFFCGDFVGEVNGDGGLKGRTVGNKDICEQCLGELKHWLNGTLPRSPSMREKRVEEDDEDYEKKESKGEEKKSDDEKSDDEKSEDDEDSADEDGEEEDEVVEDEENADEDDEAVVDEDDGPFSSRAKI